MGGMVKFTCAWMEESMNPYALKTFSGQQFQLAGRFETEVAHWVGDGEHPNIVTVLLKCRYWITSLYVLEWVAGDKSHGTDLRSWLRHGPLNLTLALSFLPSTSVGVAPRGERKCRASCTCT